MTITGRDSEFAETIEALYLEELGRKPDYLGFCGWLNQLRNGMTGEQLRAALHDSEEGALHRAQPDPIEPPKPEPHGELTSWPRRGASLYGLFGDPLWDWHEFGKRLSDCGMNLTRWWAMGGWRDWQGRLPFGPRRPDGRFDLFTWNTSYFEDAQRLTEHYNSLGIVVMWTILDLYNWSDRKQGLPGIPDANAGPFRNNVNGIRWADDHTFDVLPDAWLTEFTERLVTALKGRAVVYEIGNEMPEKAMHARIRAVIQATDPTARISVNRNSDSPGQYANMDIGRAYDFISFHGWKTLAHMDERFAEEATTGRPDTYRKLFESMNAQDHQGPARIIACSDGARSNSSNAPYDLPALLEAFRFAWSHGANVEHQSQSKMRLFNDGSHALDTFEAAFCQRLAQL